MTDRPIPTFTMSLLPPSSGKKGPRLFCLQTTQLISPQHCSFPPKHIASLPTWPNVHIHRRQTSNLKQWRLSSTSPKPQSQYPGSALPVIISATLHSHLLQGHKCWTGHSRQRSAVPSANLEGKCQQKESVNRNWKKGYLKKVGEEFTGA